MMSLKVRKHKRRIGLGRKLKLRNRPLSTAVLWFFGTVLAFTTNGSGQTTVHQPTPPPHRVDPDWPARSEAHPWGAMSAIAIDAEDNVWSFNRGRMPVQVFAPDGRLIRAWGADRFKAPHYIRIDSEGNVWTSDAHHHVVEKFTPEGDLLLTLGVPGEPGAGESNLNMPTDMAIASDGHIFVSDGYGNRRIVHFDPEGRFVRAWGSEGADPGQFALPHSIAIDSKGRLYVVDRSNNRIQIFDRSGQFLDQWGYLGRNNLVFPNTIWITPEDEIYVAGAPPRVQVDTGPTSGGRVVKFAPDGRVLKHWAFPAGEVGTERPGEVKGLHGFAVDSKADLYLGELHNKRIQKFVRRP